MVQGGIGQRISGCRCSFYGWFCFEDCLMFLPKIAQIVVRTNEVIGTCVRDIQTFFLLFILFFILFFLIFLWELGM